MVNTIMVAGRFLRLGNLHPANRYEHIAWLRMGDADQMESELVPHQRGGH